MSRLRAVDPNEGPLTRLLLRTLVPGFLLTVCPPAAIVFWHVNAHHLGSFASFGREIAEEGLAAAIWGAWGPVFWGSPAAWTILAVFAAVQLALMRWVPGPVYEGPETPGGQVPRYIDNGVACFALTMVAFVAASFGLGLFSPGIVWDHFGAILGALNLVAWALCLVLYAKGRWAPSGPDHSHTGNPIFDIYWGTELYPRILGWDIKQFTNCRFGLMGWAVILVSFAGAQLEREGQVSSSMLVAVAIQLVYITKFFRWETGYLASMDIQVDRAGFYICWGCLVWVPAIYTSPTCYLVQHPHDLPLPLALGIFGLGVGAVVVNYLADEQRQRVRETGGQTLIWGRAPDLIPATYTTERGERRQTLLLASGYWGIARHFHYVPEIAGAFLWSLPALFGDFLPYFYVCFLTVLLVHRSRRDERKCARKYGAAWEEYRRRVPHRIVPGLY